MRVSNRIRDFNRIRVFVWVCYFLISDSILCCFRRLGIEHIMKGIRGKDDLTAA